MKATKILFINTEVMPYMPENSVSRLGRQLPQGVQERGHEIRIFMPRFGLINERRNQLHEVIRLSGMNLIINDTDHPLIIKVASIPAARMQVYFIDNDDYFNRKYTFTDADGTEFPDNAERCLFYARGVIETIRKLRWIPDVVYCQGWFSAIAPLYIKKSYAEDPCFRNAKVVFALHDNAFTVPFFDRFSRLVRREGILNADMSDIVGRPVTYTDLCHMAIRYSDGVIIADEGVDASLADFAQSLGRPVLRHWEEEGLLDAYNDFLEKIAE